MRLDKLPARGDFAAHQRGEDGVRLLGIVHGDPEHDAVIGVHRRVPELLGIHFTKTFVALDVDLAFFGSGGLLAFLFRRVRIGRVYGVI